MDRRKIILRHYCKYGLLILTVFALYILQSIPGFLKIFFLKPALILPFCLTLSMLDESRSAFAVYIAGGLLNDMSCGRMPGAFTIQLVILCVRGIVAVKFFLQASKRNVYFFNFAAMSIMLSIDFFFSYILGGFHHMGFFYIKSVVLMSAYSALFSLLFLPFIEWVNMRFIRFDAR